MLTLAVLVYVSIRCILNKKVIKDILLTQWKDTFQEKVK